MIGNEFERLRRNILINMGGGVVSPVSYLIKTDNTRIDFELANTDMYYFRVDGLAIHSLIINGIYVTRNEVKEIVFGESYLGITSIGNYFLQNLTSLISADLAAFKNITSIGNYFLRNCGSLTSIDLSSFKNVTSISGQFLQDFGSLTSIDLSSFKNVTSFGSNLLTNATSLTSIQIGGLDASKFLTGVTGVANVSTSKVYANTLALGNAFKAKFPNISNWTVVVN